MKTEDQSKSFPKGIDLVAYINLDIRTDRREEMDKELDRLEVPVSKRLRWTAIRNKKNGSLGCTLSHIALLEHIATLPDNIQIILVLEDDFNFIDDASLVINSLNKFLQYPRELWDVCLLAYFVSEHQDKDDLVSIALSSQGTSGFLVNRHCIEDLVANFKEGRDKLIETGLIYTYSLDIYWWRFMESRRCFYFNKHLGYQRFSYSNIRNICLRADSCLKEDWLLTTSLPK